MKYLVTGGAGFIGSHLCDALLAAGHRVRVLDDLSSGKRENMPEAVEFVQGSIIQPADVERAVDGVDGCFHLAAIASVAQSVEHWVETHRVNQSGAVRVFETAAQSGVPVVYASSAAVYGDNASLPLSESANTAPLTPYGLDKLAVEWQARMGRDIKQLKSFGLRFFNIYGPRQDPASPYAGVISIFMEKFASQAPLTIFGDGKQSRDFVYVRDAVRHLVAAMEFLQAQPQPCAQVANVCRGHAINLLDMIALMREISAAQLQVTHQEARVGDIRHSQGSPDYAKELLGISAETDFKKGLEATWQHFVSQRG
jgi:UDP-glucose 4-epimerase